MYVSTTAVRLLVYLLAFKYGQVRNVGLLRKFLLNPVNSDLGKWAAVKAQREGKKNLFLVESLVNVYFLSELFLFYFPSRSSFAGTGKSTFLCFFERSC